MSVFFRLMFFIPFIRSFLLLDEEEVGNAIGVVDADAQRHAELLGDINDTAKALATFISEYKHPWLTFEGPYRVFQRLYPRVWWLRKRYGHYEMQMVRLRRLHRPLWLGADGVIYRAYETTQYDGLEYPGYLMRAEIEWRDIAGLEYILHRLELALSKCDGLEG